MSHPKQITLDSVVHEFFTQPEHSPSSPLCIGSFNVLRLVARESTRPEIMLQALLRYLRKELNSTDLNYALGLYQIGQHAPEALGAFHLGSILTPESLLMPVVAHTNVYVRINTRSTLGNSVTVYPLTIAMRDILRQYHEKKVI